MSVCMAVRKYFNWFNFGGSQENISFDIFVIFETFLLSSSSPFWETALLDFKNNLPSVASPLEIKILDRKL